MDDSTQPIDAKSQRLAEMIQEYRDELSPLVDEAAQYRAAISGAKTFVKRDYFKKKLKKIQSKVVGKLVNINHIEAVALKHKTEMAAKVNAE